MGTTANISASDVIKLRQMTGVGLMLCKDALLHSGGDFEQAKAYIRAKHNAVAQEIKGNCGLIAGRCGDHLAAIVEISTETDFAARSEDVVKAARYIAWLLAESAGTAAEIKSIEQEMSLKTGEAIVVRRRRVLTKPESGDFACYVHHNDQVGSIVVFGSETGSPIPQDVKNNIAMHVAAADPQPLSITKEGISASILDAEICALQEKAKSLDKPDAIRAKIVQGGLDNFVRSRSLMTQPIVTDPSRSVGETLPTGVDILDFVRFQVGQGG